MKSERSISINQGTVMPDAGTTTPAKKPLTPFQKKVRRTARQKAKAAGLDWKTMPKEERMKMRQEARKALQAEAQEKKPKASKTEL